MEEDEIMSQGNLGEDRTMSNENIEDGTMSEDNEEDGIMSQDNEEDGTMSQDNVEDGTMSQDNEENGTMSQDNVEDGTMSQDNVEDGTMSQDNVEDGTMSQDNVEDGTMSQDNVEDGTMSQDNVEDGTMSQDNVEDGTMSQDNVEDGTMSQDNVEDGTMSQINVEDGTISQEPGVDNQEKMLAIVKAWSKETVFETKGVFATQEKILSKECVCVVGVPGAGKSTAIHHAALSLESKEYALYLINGPEEFWKYFDQDKEQVFILDDVLGVHSLDQNKVKLWNKQNNSIKRVLGTDTKLLVSIRSQIYKQAVKDNALIFLDKCSCIDFCDQTYRLDTADMKGMLKKHLNDKNVDNADDLIRQVFYRSRTKEEVQGMTEEQKQLIELRNPFTEDLTHWFPFLCKVFCSDEAVRRKPAQFFENPFEALTKIFEKIKHNNKLQFCGLVLCTVFDGKLTDDMFSISCEENKEIDEKSLTLRNVILKACNLEEDLVDIQTALNCLDGIYISRIGNTYQMSHAIFHDIVTSLFNGTQPLFVLKYGTRKLIHDKIRISQTQPEDNPNIIIMNDNKNVERLADRLVSDLMSETPLRAWHIACNPNVHDDRLLSHLQGRLFDKEQRNMKVIDEIFRNCICAVYLGNTTKYKLIELCIEAGVDCNLNFCLRGANYPLHAAVTTGNLQLAKLLLNNGADIRRVHWGDSVLHLVYAQSKHNKLELVKLLTQHKGDQYVVEFITSDKDGILQELTRDNVQLEEVLPDNSIKILTTDKHEIKHYVEHSTGKLQLVKRIHDNILTYVDWQGRNILHLSAHDYIATDYLLHYPCLQLDINKRDKEGKSPYWYVKNEDENDLGNKEDMLNLYNKHGAIEYEIVDDSEWENLVFETTARFYEDEEDEMAEVIYDQKKEVQVTL